MEPVDVRGRFMWHQLLTHDVAGAKRFYTALVGWKAQPWPLDPSYTVCHAGKVPAAGIMEFTPEVPADAPPHWLPYIGTRDVDSVAEAAARAGGSIIKQPADLPGAGRSAVIQDPQGAVFAIIDPENARLEPKGMPPFAQFAWHELATSDAEAAFAFYSELFGWEAITRLDMGADVGEYLIFGKEGVQKGGIYIKSAEMPAPPHWLPYANIPDVDEGVAVVEAGGGQIIQAPMEVPGGSRIAILIDPSGATFAITSPPAVASSEQPSQPSADQPKASTKPRTKLGLAPKVTVKAKAKSKGKVKTKAKAKVKPKVKVKTKVKAKVSSVRKKAAKKSGSRKNVGRKSSALKNKSAKNTARRKK